MYPICLLLLPVFLNGDRVMNFRLGLYAIYVILFQM